jgi:hypothetical protein
LGNSSNAALLHLAWYLHLQAVQHFLKPFLVSDFSTSLAQLAIFSMVQNVI